MNDEIKEILDYLKIENGTIGSELSYEETHLLLDYITNLQTIEREYSTILSENAELQQENERLKELCDKYEEEHNTTFKEWQKDIQANKKAIEYINNNKHLSMFADCREPEKDWNYDLECSRYKGRTY